MRKKLTPTQWSKERARKAAQAWAETQPRASSGKAYRNRQQVLMARAINLLDHPQKLVRRMEAREAAADPKSKTPIIGRRAQLAKVEWERFTLDEVIARDGPVCGICGGRVDLRLRWPDPYSKSLDHVLPVSRGGPHMLSNAQLAHVRCNSRKGAR